MRKIDLNNRHLPAALAAGAGALGLGAALVLEHGFDYAPCSLCWAQRMMLTGVILFAVLSAVLAQRSRRASMALGTGALLTSLGGIFLAARHLYIGMFADGESSECAPSLSMVQQMYGQFELLLEAFIGTGESLAGCAEMADVLGIPVPALSGALFVLLSLVITRRVKPRPSGRGYKRRLALSPNDDNMVSIRRD